MGNFGDSSDDVFFGRVFIGAVEHPLSCHARGAFRFDAPSSKSNYYVCVVLFEPAVELTEPYESYNSCVEDPARDNLRMPDAFFLSSSLLAVAQFPRG